MHITTLDKGFIETDNQNDYHKIYECDMNDEGYLFTLNEKQLERMKGFL